MFASALWGDRGYRAFDQFEQGLLHPFAGYVTGDGWIISLAGNLVDLIDVDDAGLGLFHIVIAFLQQLLDDALHILTDVTGLGQCGGIGDGEGHIEEPGQRFSQ